MATLPKMAVGGAAGASLMALVMTTVVPQIQVFEGSRSTAYRDIGGVLTVCSGHTGPDVVVGKVYNKSQCATLTQSDAQKAAQGVLKASPQMLYHPIQLAALVSFSYNVGVGTYDKSSVASSFNAGDFTGGCNNLLKYTYVNGKYDAGLANRRQQEYLICTSTLTVKGLTNGGLAISPTK
jgi:lysozyme